MNTGLINWNGSSDGLSVTQTEVTGNIYGALARINIKQVYRNAGAKEMDTVYRFALPPCAYITDFDAVKAKERIGSFIMEKDEAKGACQNTNGFEDSSSAGKPNESDTLEFAVGPLLPNETVSIHISYIQEFKFRHNRLRIVIPPFWAPSCLSASFGDRSDGEDGPKPKVSLKISVDLLRRILNCYSISHTIKVDIQKESGAVISLSEEPPQMDRDLILVFTCYDEESSGGVFCRGGKAGGTVYLSFVPAFPLAEESSARDYTFLVDVSDAMTAEGLAQAKYALNTFLRNLSETDTFSIAAFGNELRPFSRGGSLPFAQASLDRAAEWIEGLAPTIGKADVFKAVRYALPPGNSRKSIILILTAGRTGNMDAPANYIRENIGRNRVFVLGTDPSANRCMLRKIAEAGRGRYECVCPGERIDDRAVRQFACIISGVADKVELDWIGLTAGDVFPGRIPNVYDLEPVTVLAQIPGPLEGKVVLRGNTGRGIFHLDLDASDIRCVSKSEFLHKVLARRKIEYLEGILAYTGPGRYETVRSEIIRLSKNHNVPSSLTTYVTVKTRSATMSSPAMPCPVRRAASVGEPNQRAYPFPDGDTLRTDGTTREISTTLTRRDILRILARNQQANGAFSPDSRDDLLTKIETTALVLTAFTAGKESIRIYTGQLQKAVRYLTERITNGRITPEQSRNSEALLKTVLALKLCHTSNMLNRTTGDWITQCLEDIRAASEASEPLVGCRNEILELLDGTEWQRDQTIKKIAAINGDPEVLLKQASLLAGESRAIPALAKMAIMEARKG